MTTQSERESIAARWLIEQDDPDFSDEQREELARWLMQSVENCSSYLRLVRAWRWTVLLRRDETPVIYRKRRSAFDHLFKHCKYDPAGSFAYRWECVLKRLDQTNAETLVEAITNQIKALKLAIVA